MTDRSAMNIELGDVNSEGADVYVLKLDCVHPVCTQAAAEAI